MEKNQHLEQLYRLSVALGTTLDLAHETAAFMGWLAEAVEPALAALFIADEAKQELRLVEADGFELPADPRLPMGLDLWHWLAEQGASVPESDPRCYAVPISIEKQLLGILCLVSNCPPEQLAEEQRLVSMAAGYLAPVLRNIWRYQTLEQQVAQRTAALQQEIAERKRAEEELQRSFEQLRRTLEGTVSVLVSAIEMRDPYTAGHQRRVTRLACAMAKEMGLSQERIEGLRMAGLIHDLGKITVPAEILSKPGPLDDLEYGLIKAHAQIGHDVLKTIEFPWPVAEIVLQHHERMDGSGYPQGLSGEEIILEARILGLADVVEAMASHRPYRPPRGLDKALEEISQNRGILYDPEVVDVCLKLFSEKRFAFE